MSSKLDFKGSSFWLQILKIKEILFTWEIPTWNNREFVAKEVNLILSCVFISDVHQMVCSLWHQKFLG